VGGEVLEGVEGGAEETEGLVLVVLVAALAGAAALLDALEEGAADEGLGGVPVAVL
jgi:hypothetical protein